MLAFYRRDYTRPLHLTETTPAQNSNRIDSTVARLSFGMK